MGGIEMNRKIMFLGLVVVISIGLIYCGTSKDEELTKIEKEPKVELMTQKVISKGAVKVFNEATGKWEAPTSGAIELKKNVKIETPKDAELKAEVTKNNFVAISGGSKVNVKEIVRTKESKRERVTMEITRGKISAKIRKLKKGEHFRIQTPVATAGVRGTKFDVDVAEDNTTTVMCVSGAVDVKSRLKKRQSAEVGAMEKVIVNPKGVVLPKEKLTKSEIERVMGIDFNDLRAGLVD